MRKARMGTRLGACYVWRMRWSSIIAATVLAACAPPEDTTTLSQAGLVRLPCRSEARLQAANAAYCRRERNWVTPAGQEVMRTVAARMARQYPNAVVLYMEASWPSGVRPMPPHLSHGDGREIDVALFYETLDGQPLPRPPNASGYGAFEPRRENDADPCAGRVRPGNNNDPPADRRWRVDMVRTRALIRALLDDPRVRRLLLEPHMKERLGFANERRIRFAGCRALRHDSHVHVDLY